MSLRSTHQSASSFCRFLSHATRFQHLRGAAVALLALGILFASSSAWAVVVPAGPHTFDGSLPGNAFVGFDGTEFVTPASAPTNTFGVSIDSGALHQDYALSAFHIDSGFLVTSSFVFDPSATGTVTPGEAIFSSIGSGAFHISDTFGIILSGSFTNATFTSAVAATAGSLSSSNISGLVLTPGPAFKFDTSSVSSIAASPTGFSISLSSIPGGVAVTSPIGLGPFIPVTLSPFVLSNGSTVVSGTMTVVPEPSAIVLVGFGALALAVPAYRRWRRKPRATGRSTIPSS